MRLSPLHRLTKTCSSSHVPLLPTFRTTTAMENLLLRKPPHGEPCFYDRPLSLFSSLSSTLYTGLSVLISFVHSIHRFVCAHLLRPLYTQGITNEIEVKLQRSALSVIEAPTDNEDISLEPWMKGLLLSLQAIQMKLRERLSNPLPKTQTVKGGTWGGFRIGHGNGATFPRAGCVESRAQWKRAFNCKAIEKLDDAGVLKLRRSTRPGCEKNGRCYNGRLLKESWITIAGGRLAGNLISTWFQWKQFLMVYQELASKERKAGSKLMETLQKIVDEPLAPPTLGAIAGFIFVAVPWLKKLVIGDDAP